MNKQKGLAPILIILLIALAIGGYLIYQKQVKPVVSQSSSNPVTSEASSSAETANWKTYTNTDAMFSIKYPSLMVYTEQFLSDSKKLKKVIFDGDEGTIRITYALAGEETAWGGGCDFDQHKKIIFLDQGKEVCLGDNYVSFYTSHPKKIADFNFYAKFSPDNKGLILNILSTFKFTQ